MKHNNIQYRSEFLDLALSLGAKLTGKPDGSEAIEVVFSIEAWRTFDAALATPPTSTQAAAPDRSAEPDDPMCLQNWLDNACYLLDTTPGAVRHRPGMGGENLLYSLISSYISLRDSKAVDPAQDDGPEFTVSDPDLDALLNAAADYAKGGQNMDTGLHLMSLLKRVEARLAPAQDSVERQAYDALRAERDSYKARAEKAESQVKQVGYSIFISTECGTVYHRSRIIPSISDADACAVQWRAGAHANFSGEIAVLPIYTNLQAAQPDTLRQVLEIVRQYPDFDGDTPFGTMIDEALEGKVPSLTAAIDSLSAGKQPAAQVAVLTKDALDGIQRYDHTVRYGMDEQSEGRYIVFDDVLTILAAKYQAAFMESWRQGYMSRPADGEKVLEQIMRPYGIYDVAVSNAGALQLEFIEIGKQARAILFAKSAPLELVKELAATAKENAALREQVMRLETELFWLKVPTK